MNCPYRVVYLPENSCQTDESCGTAFWTVNYALDVSQLPRLFRWAV